MWTHAALSNDWKESGEHMREHRAEDVHDRNDMILHGRDEYRLVLGGLMRLRQPHPDHGPVGRMPSTPRCVE